MHGRKKRPDRRHRVRFDAHFAKMREASRGEGPASCRPIKYRQQTKTAGQMNDIVTGRVLVVENGVKHTIEIGRSSRQTLRDR